MEPAYGVSAYGVKKLNQLQALCPILLPQHKFTLVFLAFQRTLHTYAYIFI